MQPTPIWCSSAHPQSIQPKNSVAQIATRARKFDHIATILEKPQFLPVRYLLVYKILLLVYKPLKGAAACCVIDLRNYHTSQRTLRLSPQRLSF